MRNIVKGEGMASIYVGNLNPMTTEGELEHLFSVYGMVNSVKIIKDPATGRSKGYGFIEIEGLEDIDQIINEMNGVEFGGKNLVVNHAIERKKESRPPQKRPRQQNYRRHRNNSD